MINFLKSLFNKIFKRTANNVEDEIAEKAANKITSKVMSKANNYQSSDNVGTQNVNFDSKDNDQAAALAYLNAMNQANGASAANGSSLKEADEFLKYMKFDDNMKWVGITEDAPEIIKMSFKQYQLEEQNDK